MCRLVLDVGEVRGILCDVVDDLRVTTEVGGCSPYRFSSKRTGIDLRSTRDQTFARLLVVANDFGKVVKSAIKVSRYSSQLLVLDLAFTHFS